MTQFLCLANRADAFGLAITIVVVAFIVPTDTSFQPLPSTTTVQQHPRLAVPSMRLFSASHETTVVTDEQALEVMERIEALDARLGVGVGGTKERAKLALVLEKWEQQQQEADGRQCGYEDAMNYDETTEEDGDDEPADDDTFWDASKFVNRHTPDERVAVYGGDPAKRRKTVEKKLAPYSSLDQFGTPRDVGASDTSTLLRKIRSGSYDVIYLWTRFNCHSSRAAIRQACTSTGTRCHEVESLAYIQSPSTTDL